MKYIHAILTKQRYLNNEVYGNLILPQNTEQSVGGRFRNSIYEQLRSDSFPTSVHETIRNPCTWSYGNGPAVLFHRRTARAETIKERREKKCAIVRYTRNGVFVIPFAPSLSLQRHVRRSTFAQHTIPLSLRYAIFRSVQGNAEMRSHSQDSPNLGCMNGSCPFLRRTALFDDPHFAWIVSHADISIDQPSFHPLSPTSSRSRLSRLCYPRRFTQ